MLEILLYSTPAQKNKRSVSICVSSKCKRTMSFFLLFLFALCAIQDLGVVGEPGGSGREECVRGAMCSFFFVGERPRRGTRRRSADARGCWYLVLSNSSWHENRCIAIVCARLHCTLNSRFCFFCFCRWATSPRHATTIGRCSRLLIFCYIQTQAETEIDVFP